MSLLDGTRALCLGATSDGAFARLLSSLGANVSAIEEPALQHELRAADFLLDDAGLPALEACGWTRERIEAVNPGLVHVSVTAFGSFGPRAGWRGSELVASALGGTLRVTGYPDRAPVKEAADACTFHAEMVAAAGALAAWRERGNSGRGQHVDVSVQEVACSRNVNGILVWQFDRKKPVRSGPALSYGRATVRCIWELQDGYCFHSLMTGRFGAPANQALSDWMDATGADNPLRGVDWLTYNRSTLPADARALWERAMDAFFRTRTKAEIAIEGRRRGINATVVHEPADVLADAHLAAREFFTGEGARRLPGRFVRVVAGPEPCGADARLGAATAASGRSLSSGRSITSDAKRAPARAASGPLAGIRVLDFSWALVGSYTTKTLGDLGADVIKVESATRPCLSRIDVQVAASKPGSFDDKPWFAHMNTSKRSLALDMKKPDARRVLEPLLDWADVVVENFSPGTMDKLGLGYATLSKRNPRLVMISGSVYGQTGPLAQEWGVDGTGAALSGRTFLTGWPDRPPVTPGAVPYGDVIVPYVMAAATAAAIAARDRSGRGCHVDASMYEICVQQMREPLAAAARGERPARSGNRDAGVFHQGVYRAAGEDRWLAVTLRDAGEWSRLCATFGLDAGATDADARDAVLTAWSESRIAAEAAEALQAEGFAAGEVQDVEDLVDRDPQIAARGALVPVDHALLGRFGHLRTPLTLSRTPVEVRSAPGLGEHVDEIAAGICGLDDATIAALRAEGVFR